jgi:hypothetical protein
MNGIAKQHDVPTPKQVRFIDQLLASVVPTDLDRLPLVERERDRIKSIVQDFKAGEQITYNEGRDLISTLIAARDAKPKPERKNAAPGYYVRHTANEFVVVIENRAKTNTYAKRLEVSKNAAGRTTARWKYVAGLGFAVADLTPMTLQEAAKFGHLHGVCFVCCKQLTDPESVKRGIGPVCAKKFA